MSNSSLVFFNKIRKEGAFTVFDFGLYRSSHSKISQNSLELVHSQNSLSATLLG